MFPTTGYLAIAVEAALQAAEVHAIDISLIQSFEFQDVLLSAALLIPDDDRGLELLTSLRPEPGNATSNGAQWSFTVTSVMNADGDDVFTEHCHGKVAYSFESQGIFALPDLLFVVANKSRFTRSSHFGPDPSTKAGLVHEMV